MAYNTTYKITTTPRSHRSEVIKSIVERVGYSPFDDETKWYEHQDDLVAVSRLHPTTVISLYGEGEDQGDQWVLHAFNGESVLHRAPKWEPPAPPEEWVTNDE